MIPKISRYKELTQQNSNFILLTDMSQAPLGTLIWQVVTHHYKIYYSLVIVITCIHVLHNEAHTQNSSWSFKPPISCNSTLYFYNTPVLHCYWVLITKRIKLYNDLNKSTFAPSDVLPCFLFFFPTACILTFQVKVSLLYFCFTSFSLYNTKINIFWQH